MLEGHREENVEIGRKEEVLHHLAMADEPGLHVIDALPLGRVHLDLNLQLCTTAGTVVRASAGHSGIRGFESCRGLAFFCLSLSIYPLSNVSIKGP